MSIENYENADFIISILPPLGSGISNSVLITDGDISLLVYNSNLTWTEADKFNTDRIKQIIPKNLFAILSYAQPNNLEEMYGDIPKKRSKLRVLIKRMLMRFMN